ncbi:MAG: RinA family protein [Oscillospiraceae bacterium]|jgi:DNA-directed RNA polymerase specialized sigma24 family protein|nr:RinA family protein [Oscillospiraceae bacterium]
MMAITTAQAVKDELTVLSCFISSIRERIDYLRSSLERTGTPMGGPCVQSSGGGNDVLPDTLSAIFFWEEKLEDYIAQVRRYASLTGNTTQRKLIMLRYADGYCWADVAAELGYSLSHCRRIKDMATSGITQKSSSLP